jgi:phosphoenolpyruvate carboxylase
VLHNPRMWQVYMLLCKQLASSMTRHPFADPFNVIQAELLKQRLRAMEEKSNLSTKEMEELDVLLKDAIVLSINVDASGMRNTG